MLHTRQRHHSIYRIIIMKVSNNISLKKNFNNIRKQKPVLFFRKNTNVNQNLFKNVFLNFKNFIKRKFRNYYN